MCASFEGFLTYTCVLFRRSELKKLDDEDSTEKPPLSEDSDTKAVASPLPYSSERDRYNPLGHIFLKIILNYTSRKFVLID